MSARDVAAWPVRSGPVPPLADCFTTRPETAPGLREALVPGAAVVLVPGRPAADGIGAGAWSGSCGTTQLAAGVAESLWRSGELDLLVWVTATSWAAVLSGYARAAAETAVTGTGAAGDAGPAAARFTWWLAGTSRRWLVVLDDLSDLADLEDLWPEGPAGRVLITTASAGGLPAERRALVLPIGTFSTREAMSYVLNRLSADPDQRLGAIDLAEELGCESLALAQATAAITASGLTCRDYQERFQRRRQQIAETTGGAPPPAAVTWTFCAETAGRLAPGADIRAMLALVALLDGHAIPAGIFTTPAALRYLAGDAASEPAGPDRARAAIRVLERTGLLTTGPTDTGGNAGDPGQCGGSGSRPEGRAWGGA